MQIAEAAVEDVFSHAREESPRECCGLLVGSGDVVTRTVRAANIDPAAARYLIDPADHFKAIRLARADGLEVIGAYHSHVASAATPSPTDVAEARNGPDFYYLIVSLSDGEVGAYRVEDGRPIQLPLRSRRARGPARSAS